MTGGRGAAGSLRAIFPALIGSPPSTLVPAPPSRGEQDGPSNKAHLRGRLTGFPSTTGPLHSVFPASIGSPPSTLVPAPPSRGEQDAPSLSPLDAVKDSGRRIVKSGGHWRVSGLPDYRVSPVM